MTTTEKIWNDFNKELLRFIKKRVKDDDIANDLLQDIFVKIHLKLSTLSDQERLTAWVYQITRNSILDHYKKNKHSAELPTDLYEREEPKTYNEEFAKCLKPFLGELPENYREALLETELGQLSQKELAEKLNISYSGAKSRIQRGRKQLLELFHQCCKSSADNYGNILEFENNKSCKGC